MTDHIVTPEVVAWLPEPWVLLQDYAGKTSTNLPNPNRPTHYNPEDGNSMLLQNVGIHL